MCNDKNIDKCILCDKDNCVKLCFIYNFITIVRLPQWMYIGRHIDIPNIDISPNDRVPVGLWFISSIFTMFSAV